MKFKLELGIFVIVLLFGAGFVSALDVCVGDKLGEVYNTPTSLVGTNINPCHDLSDSECENKYFGIGDVGYWSGDMFYEPPLYGQCILNEDTFNSFFRCYATKGPVIELNRCCKYSPTTCGDEIMCDATSLGKTLTSTSDPCKDYSPAECGNHYVNLEPSNSVGVLDAAKCILSPNGCSAYKVISNELFDGCVLESSCEEPIEISCPDYDSGHLAVCNPATPLGEQVCTGLGYRCSETGKTYRCLWDEGLQPGEYLDPNSDWDGSPYCYGGVGEEYLCEDCVNNIDDDGNGLTDCYDPVCCGSDPVCENQQCGDGPCRACLRINNPGETYEGSCFENSYPYVTPEGVCCNSYLLSQEENPFRDSYSWMNPEDCVDYQTPWSDILIRVIVDDTFCMSRDITLKTFPYSPNFWLGSSVYYEEYSTGFKIKENFIDLHHPPPESLREETVADEIMCRYFINSEIAQAEGIFGGFNIVNYDPPMLIGERKCSEEIPGWYRSYELGEMPVRVSMNVKLKDDGEIINNICKDDLESIKEISDNPGLFICPDFVENFTGSLHTSLKFETERKICRFEIDGFTETNIKGPEIPCDDDPSICEQEIIVNTPNGPLAPYKGSCTWNQQFCEFDGHPEIDNVRCKTTGALRVFNRHKDCQDVEIDGQIYTGRCEVEKKFCEFDIKKESYDVTIPCYTWDSTEDCQGIEVGGEIYNGVCDRYNRPNNLFPYDEDATVDIEMNVEENYYSPANDPLYGPQRFVIKITIKGYASHIFENSFTEQGRIFGSPVTFGRTKILDGLNELVSSTRTGSNRLPTEEEFENILIENIESTSKFWSVFAKDFINDGLERVLRVEDSFNFDLTDSERLERQRIRHEESQRANIEYSAIVVDRIIFTVTPDLMISALEEIDITQVKFKDPSEAVRDDDSGTIPRTVTTLGPYTGEGSIFWSRDVLEMIGILIIGNENIFRKHLIPTAIENFLESRGPILSSDVVKKPKIYGTFTKEITNSLEEGSLGFYPKLLSCFSDNVKTVSSKSSFYILKNFTDDRLEGIGYEINSNIVPLENIIKSFNDTELFNKNILVLNLSGIEEVCTIELLEQESFDLDVERAYNLTSSDGYVNVEIPENAFSESAIISIDKINVGSCNMSISDMFLEVDFNSNFSAFDYYNSSIETFEEIFGVYSEMEMVSLNMEKWINSEISVGEIFSVF